MEDKRYRTLEGLYGTEGKLDLHLHLFGDELAKREGYRGIDGFEAIQLYLITKYGWLPRDVRSMSREDIRLVLHREMEGWTLPEKYREAAVSSSLP